MYIGSKNKGSYQKNDKIKNHLDNLHKSRRAKYGRWKCKICNMVFDTREQLTDHMIDSHNGSKLIKLSDNLFKCPYCDYSGNLKQVMGHQTSCNNHPLKKEHLEAQNRGIKKLKEKFKSGEIINGFKNHKHSDKSKQKMRISTCNYLNKINNTPCRYNKKSIPILEEIGKEHGWHLQHAENGGEFYTGIGFYVDAYDKEKNIVVEYDEKKHYVDVDNNILKYKDIKRQTEIIEHLHCEFYRYNEKTGKLWKV